jgi:hypothetical protein
MWERYADNRRGVCIHFRCALGTPFGFSQRVDYVHVLDPLLVPFDDMEEREIARRATLSKLVQWQEEREYRFLLYPGTSFDEAGLHIQGRYGYFNPGEVVGVSVGDQMPEQYLEELKAMLRERAGGAVPLFRARV